MQDIHAAYTDSAAASPAGLFVDQESWAYTVNEVADDFIIIRYTIKNLGTDPLDDLYAGVFLDLDLGDLYTNDTGGTVDSLDLVYMTDTDGIHAGISYISDIDDPPLSNLTLIFNPDYVWPNGYILDEDKWGFLTAADSQHVLTEPDSLMDYCALAAAGPFDLEPSGERLVSFAILGGESLDELMQNAHVARMICTGGFTDVEEEVSETIQMSCLRPAFPNPFRDQTVIRFDLADAGPVKLRIYDVDGRLVRRISDEAYLPGSHRLIWDGRTGSGRRAAAGVYFLRFDSKEVRTSRRLILLK
jgi:hypothetical protein